MTPIENIYGRCEQKGSSYSISVCKKYVPREDN